MVSYRPCSVSQADDPWLQVISRDERFGSKPMSNTSLEKSKIRILLLEGVHQSAIDTLNAAGYTNIEYLTHSLGEEELIEKIADAHFVGIRSRTQLTEKVFEAARKLVAVGCFCIGTNQVDLQAATRRGVADAKQSLNHHMCSFGSLVKGLLKGLNRHGLGGRS